MDRKVMSVAVSIMFALCVATVVTASSPSLNTPLYTFRMEQQSNKLNFLPTAVNEFIYTVENEYIMNVDAPVEFCNAQPLDNCTYLATTCNVTCPQSCAGTCDTCYGWTCYNTSCQPTCEYTCDDPTCAPTCDPTCFDWTCKHSTCSSGQMCK